MMRNHLAAPLAALAVAAASPSPAAAVELVPHEAVYRVTLLETTHKNAIVQSHGALGMRSKRHCGAWQSQSELLFTMELDNGKKVRVHNMLRERENIEARRVEFDGWTDSDKSGKVLTRGVARVPAADEPGEAMFEKPKKEQRKLAIGVGLPTEVFVKTLDQLTAGETPAPVHYFEPDSKYTEMRLLGGAPTILKTPPEGDAALVEGKSWQVRITPIFETESFNDLGAHTIMQVHANGVVSHMIIDLGTMRLEAALVKVRRIDSSGCAPPPVAATPKASREELPKEGISIEEIPTLLPKDAPAPAAAEAPEP
jgi:hypothetical protein